MSIECKGKLIKAETKSCSCKKKKKVIPKLNEIKRKSLFFLNSSDRRTLEKKSQFSYHVAGTLLRELTTATSLSIYEHGI